MHILPQQTMNFSLYVFQLDLIKLDLNYSFYLLPRPLPLRRAIVYPLSVRVCVCMASVLCPVSWVYPLCCFRLPVCLQGSSYAATSCALPRTLRLDWCALYIHIYMLDSHACHAHWAGGGCVCVLATFLLSFVSLTAWPGRLSARQSKALDLLAFVAWFRLPLYVCMYVCIAAYIFVC